VARRTKLTAFIVAGLAVALALAFFVSPQASGDPDGLERVAIDEGFADEATTHDLADSPLADYGVEGVDDERISTGLSGIIGVAVTFAVAGGALFLYRQARRRRAPEPVAPAEG
jgi:cobalt/nickel transport system permease protein